MTDEYGLPRLVSLQAGSGAGRVHLGHLRDAHEPAILAQAAEAIRAAAQGLGGHMILEAAPPSVKERVSVWGPVEALDVMAEIKAQFDPADVLNPGRFVL